MNMTRHLVFLSSVFATVLMGCGGDEPPAKAPDNPPASRSEANVGASAGDPMQNSTASATPAATPSPSTTAATASSETTPPADATPALSDDQILQVVHTANAGEIEQAKLAQSKAKDARVKKLAAMMVKDHTEADGKDMTVAKKASLKLSPSPTSTSLESDAHGATATLKSESGADFDKGYVDTQVKEHQAVLDMIDQKLEPNAKNMDVKAFLVEVRTKVAMHLAHAQDLQTALQK
jgi:putative membrane protein